MFLQLLQSALEAAPSLDSRLVANESVLSSISGISTIEDLEAISSLRHTIYPFEGRLPRISLPHFEREFIRTKHFTSADIAEEDFI